MAEYAHEPGPIHWDDLDLEPGPLVSGDFEDLLARAAMELPDLSAAIDRAQLDATPTDPADTDTSDDQDLIDGAAELAGAAARVQELRPLDELAALDGQDPMIDAGARDVPADDQAPTPVGDDELEKGERDWREHGTREGSDAGGGP